MQHSTANILKLDVGDVQGDIYKLMRLDASVRDIQGGQRFPFSIGFAIQAQLLHFQVNRRLVEMDSERRPHLHMQVRFYIQVSPYVQKVFLSFVFVKLVEFEVLQFYFRVGLEIDVVDGFLGGLRDDEVESDEGDDKKKQQTRTYTRQEVRHRMLGCFFATAIDSFATLDNQGNMQ